MSLLRPLARVHGSIPADQLLTYMREKRIHQVLVVGANGQVEGLITLEDVVAELIGGVSDEFKGAPARAILPARRQRQAPGRDARGSGRAGAWRRLEESRRHRRRVHHAHARRRACRQASRSESRAWSC